MTSIQTFGPDFLAAVKSNVAYTYPIIFILALGKSLAIISLILPFVSMLLIVGSLVGIGGGDVALAWLAGTTGACLGYWISFELGNKYRDRIRGLISGSPWVNRLDSGLAFFETWGTAAVFAGRFFAPLRATVALAAGMAGMNMWAFQFMNIASASLWVAGLLAPSLLAQWMPWQLLQPILQRI